MTDDFIGMQIGPISFIDEGVDGVLDTLQERAAVNSLVIAPLSWAQSVAGRADYGSPGHGVVGDHPFTGGAFWEPDPQYYTHNLIQAFRAPDALYKGFDALREVIPAARQRGMKIYPYYFETGPKDRPTNVPNFVQIVEVDAYGRKATRPCLYHPEYRSWIFSVIEDTCQSLDIDGILWGVERQGPLMSMLEGDLPTCFCEYCRQEGERRGIDVEQARQGYVEFHRYLEAITEGEAPRDGYFVTFLRILLRYPEVLQWEKLWLDAHKSFYQEIYGLIKFLNPNIELGLGIWYRITTTNPYLRAQYDYSELKGVCDWIKPILYHVPMGARFSKWVSRLQATILKDMSADEAVNGLYRILHLDEAPLDTLPTKGFSPEYVRQETQRVVDAIDGAAKVYPAIGIGMRNPGGREVQPEDVKPAIRAAYEGGADGILLCRMYAEIPVQNLDAAGDVLRELGRV